METPISGISAGLPPKNDDNDSYPDFPAGDRLAKVFWELIQREEIKISPGLFTPSLVSIIGPSDSPPGKTLSMKMVWPAL